MAVTGVRRPPYTRAATGIGIDTNFLELLANAAVSGSGKIWEDISGVPSGLMDLAGLLGQPTQDQSILAPAIDPMVMGERLGAVTEESIRETAQTIMHPGEAIQEHPGYFLLDLLGLAAGGAGMVGRAARHADMSPAAFLSDELGAITPFGRLIDEKGPPSVVENLTALGLKTEDRGISNPNVAMARYPEGSGLAIVKPGSSGYDQAAGELAMGALDRALGGRARTPAVVEGDFPYYPRGGDLEQRSGSIMEYLTGAESTQHDWDVTSFADQFHAPEDLRRISLVDFLVGNSDRYYGHNMMTHEGRPVGIDYGLTFGEGGIGKRGDVAGIGPGDFYFDRNVWGITKGKLLPEETQLAESVQQIIADTIRGLYDPRNQPHPVLADNVSERALTQILERAHRVLNEEGFTSGRFSGLYSNSRHPGAPPAGVAPGIGSDTAGGMFSTSPSSFVDPISEQEALRPFAVDPVAPWNTGSLQEFAKGHTLSDAAEIAQPAGTSTLEQLIARQALEENPLPGEAGRMLRVEQENMDILMSLLKTIWIRTSLERINVSVYCPFCGQATEYMSVGQVAKALNWTPRQVRYHIKRGHFPGTEMARGISSLCPTRFQCEP